MNWELIISNGGLITLILGLIGFAFRWRLEKNEPVISAETAEAAIEFQRVQASDTVASRAMDLSEKLSKRLETTEESLASIQKANTILMDRNEELTTALNVIINWTTDIRVKWDEYRKQSNPPNPPKISISMEKPTDPPQ